MIEELVITDQSYCEGEDAFWIWAACSRGGLWLSRNGGVDWEQVVLDATRPSPDSAFNQIISLAAYGGPSHIVDDTLHYLFAGSAGGVWFINIDSLDNPNGFAVLHRLYEIDSVPSMIADVAVNLWTNVNQDDSEIVDTTLEIALATRPASGQVGFAVLLSDDFGQTWDVSLTGWNIGRLDYADSSIVAASTAGLLLYSHASESWGSRAIYDQVQDYTIDTVLNVVIFDRIKRLFWVGAEYALAKSAFLLPGTWQVDTVNLNPELFDHNIRARSGSGESGLSGDFVVAIEVQYHEGERYIWVAANSTGQAGESDGINLSTNNGRTFDIVLNNINAWNFAFDGGDVYAATSSGLLKTSDFGDTWDTMEIVDAQTGAEIYAGTEFFGVAVAEGVVWAASDDGMAFSTDNGTSWTVERTFQALPDESGATVYASPLPCSPYSTAGGRVRFHYKFPEAGSVTIKIYDFAMHLVSTPVDGQPREANLQYDEDSWDMRNDNGDLVSAGPYYFKVEHSSGREEWGKILVIP